MLRSSTILVFVAIMTTARLKSKCSGRAYLVYFLFPFPCSPKWNYCRRVAKYGGGRSKSSVPKVNPWCFVVAEHTPGNYPGHGWLAAALRMRMYLWWEMQLKMSADETHHSAHDSEEGGGGHMAQSVVATRCRNFVNGSTFSALHLATNI